MIWRSLICFSVCLPLSLGSSASGRVTLVDKKHGKTLMDNSAGIVVWLEAKNAGGGRVSPGHFTILQKNKTFTPHVLAVPVGSTVDFPNTDPIFHNAFSNYDGQIFDIGLYPPGTSRSVTFSRAGIVRIFCNIHASMSAVVVALRTPYFAITGSDGAFHIADVPEGRYQLLLYSEQVNEKVLRDQSREVEIGGSPAELSPIALPRTAFLNIPHLNKYGKEYPAESNSIAYPGAKP